MGRNGKLIQSKIDSRTAKVCIVGLGYVGVPLAAAVSGKATRSLGVWQGSAAQQAQEMVPEGVTVVAALHTVGAPSLGDPGTELDEDVLICGDRKADKARVARLIELIPGLRAVNAGPLETARIVEQLTPLLISVNVRYKTHADNRSLYNTPPVFTIYVMRLVMKWLVEQGGLAAAERRNKEKAALIYDTIDASTFYRGHAQADCRSLMNVTFRLASEELEKAFVKESTAAGLDGLKGHRSVGGMRASIYNAFPEQGIDALVAFMREFEAKRG